MLYYSYRSKSAEQRWVTVGYTVFMVKFYIFQSRFPLLLFWSSSCTQARLGAMDADQTSGLFDLDQEMEILRSLAARTPSFPRRSTVKIEEESRNDAVVGSSGVSKLREGYPSGQTNRSQRVLPHATVFVFVAEVYPEDNRFAGHEGNATEERHRITVAVPRMHSKLLGTFKLPKFDGTPRAWKQWDRDFVRFLGLHQLEHVLLEGFLLLLPHPDAVAANKIVYFLVEEAVLPGTLASKYVRQAALWDGHGAYILLYNGFVFSGPQTATVLMAELSNMRFQSGETGTAFCLRLTEVLEDLEHLPGTSAIILNDTQKLGYLLSAIRHERDLSAVYVQLQTDQLRGKVTFEQACQELHFRCEAIRADALLDSRFKPTGKVLISTEIKHLDKEKLPCLAKGCEGMIVAFLPLCKGCFLQCKSGKVASLELRDGLGSAKYNATTAKLEFPPGVPKSRLPGNRPKKEVRKGLMIQVANGSKS